jgi:hypothetical protein
MAGNKASASAVPQHDRIFVVHLTIPVCGYVVTVVTTGIQI